VSEVGNFGKVGVESRSQKLWEAGVVVGNFGKVGYFATDSATLFARAYNGHQNG